MTEHSQGAPVRAILHVGAPKCGSSALQRALSAQPELRGADGRRHIYMAGRVTEDGLVPVTGRRLAAMMRHSVHGYLSWPNVSRQDDQPAYWAQVGAGIAAQTRAGRVPILSSEGWIAHADQAPALAAAAGLETLDAIVFVRPPLDWLNAAYWQWGIWHTGFFHNRQVERWLERARYDVGPHVAAWARAPNVRLAVDSARADVVAGFAARYGLPLQAGDQVNSAPPPALTGFFLRNRRFRPTPHDSAAEFVVQRWCQFAPSDKLWAFLPRFAQEVWPRLQDDVARMMEALPPETAERLLAEPGWTSLDPYWARMKAGPTRLDAPEALADLYDGIAKGARAAGAGSGAGDVSRAKPAASAPVEDWDAAIAVVLDRLLEADLRWRRRGAMRRMIGV